MITTRKVTLYPLGDKEERSRVYRYIQNGQKIQAHMMNKCISALYCAITQGLSFKDEEYKEIRRLHSRVPSSSKGSAYDFDMSLYPTGMETAGNVPRICEAKLVKAMKEGLMYGKVSLPTFRDTIPMYVTKRNIGVLGSDKKITTGFYTNYSTSGELAERIYEDDKCVFLKFANKIEFVVKFGNPYRSRELRNVFERIFSGEYKVCDSTIGIDKNDSKKIILYLVVDMPITKENKLNDDIVLGVDISSACPCVCALNNYSYSESFGNYEDFIRVRKQMQAQRSSIQSHLKDTKGGHGRKKKLAHLDKLTLNERNFAHTYNHTVSKRIVDFAVKSKAKYINLEDLSGIKDDKDRNVDIRNWSYYELQSMIEYKALREGITVRKVANKVYDPDLIKELKDDIEIKNGKYVYKETGESVPFSTMDIICSCCNNIGEINESKMFICSNPACKIHKKYPDGISAQINKARNLALSELFVNKEKEKKKKEE